MLLALTFASFLGASPAGALRSLAAAPEDAAPGGGGADVVVAGGRRPALHALISSIGATAAAPQDVHVWVISASREEHEDLHLRGRILGTISTISLKDVEEDLLAQGIEPVWLWKDFGSADAEGWEQDDAKHAFRYNHVRFYLPHLRWFQKLEKFILLDDDVIVQKDLSLLMQVQLDPNRVLASTCDVWKREAWGAATKAGETWHRGTMKLSHSGALNMASVPLREEQRAILLPFVQSLNHLGESELDEQVDWNFGVALFDVKHWQQHNITGLYHDWMRANSANHLVPKRSLVFGRGLPQIALLARHQCLRHIRVADALGWVQLEDLKRNGLNDSFILDAFALHYAGTNKPWDSRSDIPDVFREPYLKISNQSREGTLPLSEDVPIEVFLQAAGHVPWSPHRKSMNLSNLQMASLRADLTAGEVPPPGTLGAAFPSYFGGGGTPQFSNNVTTNWTKGDIMMRDGKIGKYTSDDLMRAHSAAESSNVPVWARVAVALALLGCCVRYSLCVPCTWPVLRDVSPLGILQHRHELTSRPFEPTAAPFEPAAVPAAG